MPTSGAQPAGGSDPSRGPDMCCILRLELWVPSVAILTQLGRGEEAKLQGWKEGSRTPPWPSRAARGPALGVSPKAGGGYRLGSGVCRHHLRPTGAWLGRPRTDRGFVSSVGSLVVSSWTLDLDHLPGRAFVPVSWRRLECLSVSSASVQHVCLAFGKDRGAVVAEESKTPTLPQGASS